MKHGSKVAFASLAGTAIEFYDFFLYGTAAALVFDAVFFPGLDPLAGTLAAFSTFAVAFVARPLGAVLFGHWGDRVGRKATLVGSLLLMGLSTVAIGLLPGYASIGVLAPLLLVVLRFAQGVGLGGEWGGAALLAVEHAPAHLRGRYAVFPQLGPSVGFVLANGAFLVAGVENWRWLFLASIVLVVVGLHVRVGLAETPAFREVRQVHRVPARALLREQGRTVALGAGAMVIAYTLFYLATTYCLAYGTKVLGVPRPVMLGWSIAGVVVMGVTTVLGALASDRIGRRRTLVIGTVAAAGWGPAMFSGLDLGVAMVGALAIMGVVYGPMGAYLPELFRPEHRYSGAALAYSLGGVLGGAVPPIVATLLQGAGLGVGAVGGYVGVSALLSLGCLLALPARPQQRALLSQGA
ncbi:MFS transporter [Nonomuraea sp. NPDC050310]|uniref:MFS transporter n=1 Tax=Nonomuraea sp. NPDC050310 TaxID=3154935 RepID=UPI0033EC515B